MPEGRIAGEPRRLRRRDGDVIPQLDDEQRRDLMGKYCFRCKAEKSVSEFGKNARRKDGLQVYCKTCTKEYRDEKAYDKRRWEKNGAVESERNRAYRAENSERLLAYYREKAERRRKDFPGKIRAANAARKLSQAMALPCWADKKAIDLIYAKARQWSGILGVEIQVDHVVPLNSKIVCGLHAPANLQLLDARINLEKRNYSWPDMP